MDVIGHPAFLFGIEQSSSLMDYSSNCFYSRLSWCAFPARSMYNLTMALTALNLPPEELKKYHPREEFLRRRAETRLEVAKRRRRALAAAQRAAQLLKAEFDANEVILFGSLTRRGSFTLFSDIDLAARGIPSTRYLAAMDAVLRLSAEFKIDLAELETCPPALLKNIAKDGRSL